MIKEAKIQIEVDNRSDTKKRLIQTRRYIVDFLAVLFILAGWIAIIYSSIYEEEFGDMVNSKFGLEHRFF